MDPVIANASGLALACVFAGAALHKWRHGEEFSRIVAGYGIVPARSSPILARLLPVLELSVALGLLVPATTAMAAALSAILLLIYSAAIGLNLARGRRTLDCGCGGPRQLLSEWLLLRNGALLVLAFAAGAGRVERQLGWLDWGVTLLAATTGCLCYHISNQLLANGDSLKTLWGDHA